MSDLTNPFPNNQDGTYHSEIDDLRAEAAEKDNRIAEYQQECKRLCFEVGFEKRRADQLRADVNNQAKSIEVYQEAEDIASQRIAELTNQHAEMVVEVHQKDKRKWLDLQKDKRIAELEAETAELIEEIEADRSIKADKDKRIAELDADNKQLRKHIRDTATAMGDLIVASAAEVKQDDWPEPRNHSGNFYASDIMGSCGLAFGPYQPPKGDDQ